MNAMENMTIFVYQIEFDEGISQREIDGGNTHLLYRAESNEIKPNQSISHLKEVITPGRASHKVMVHDGEVLRLGDRGHKPTALELNGGRHHHESVEATCFHLHLPLFPTVSLLIVHL